MDAVLEHASGEVVAIEVKAAETVRAEDLRGIRRLSRGRTGVAPVDNVGRREVPWVRLSRCRSRSVR